MIWEFCCNEYLLFSLCLDVAGGMKQKECCWCNDLAPFVNLFKINLKKPLWMWKLCINRCFMRLNAHSLKSKDSIPSSAQTSYVALYEVIESVIRCLDFPLVLVVMVVLALCNWTPGCFPSLWLLYCLVIGGIKTWEGFGGWAYACGLYLIYKMV